MTKTVPAHTFLICVVNSHTSSTASPNAIHKIERLEQLLESEKGRAASVRRPSPCSKTTKPVVFENLQGELAKKDELIHKWLSNKKNKDDGSSTKSSEWLSQIHTLTNVPWPVLELHFVMFV